LPSTAASSGRGGLQGCARRLVRGVKEWLGTLLGLVVSGGYNMAGPMSEVLRLDLATLKWVTMPAHMAARYNHACCVVRKALVVLNGNVKDEEGISSRVEITVGRG